MANTSYAFIGNDTTIINGNETEPVSEEECIQNVYYRTTMVTLFVLSISMSGAENVVLWIAYVANKGLRTKANTYMISLSCSDFFTTISLAWMEVYYIWHYPYWSFGELGTMLQNSFWCLSLVTPFAHVTVMTYDRYKAVVSTISYQLMHSWTFEYVKIACIWIYSVLVVVLMQFHFTPAPGKKYEWNVAPVWYYPFLGIHIAIPLAVCSAFYLKILQYVLKERKNLQRMQGGKLGEIKLARTVAIIIICLYVVWLPVIGMEVVYGVLAHTCIVSQVGTASVWLTCTSGVINPIIFLSKNKAYRSAIRSFFCGKRKSKASASDASLASSKTNNTDT